MEVVPLHHNTGYLDICVEVLNEEWTRSKTARLHSLEKSCDELPTCLVLLNKQGNLIGHTRLSRIRGREKSCLVESVVVRKKDRGKGFGRHLMLETEKYAKSQGFDTMYLTTHDKEMFYSRLGYQYCQPVLSFGGDFKNLPESFTKSLGSLSGWDNKQQSPEASSKVPLPIETHPVNDNCSRVQNNNCIQDIINCETEEPQVINSSSLQSMTRISAPSPFPASTSIPAPPPIPASTSIPGPPPIPASTCIPAPPPVPKPSLPSVQPNNSVSQKRPIVRWDPSKVSWMKKTL